jgi:hypothetical protein
MVPIPPHRHEEAVPVGHAWSQSPVPEVRRVQFTPSGEVRMAPIIPHRHEDAVPVDHTVERVVVPFGEVGSVHLTPSREVRMVPLDPTATKRPFP